MRAELSPDDGKHFKILEYLFTDYIHWIHTWLHLDIYPQFDITLMRFIYILHGFTNLSQTFSRIEIFGCKNFAGQNKTLFEFGRYFIHNRVELIR